MSSITHPQARGSLSGLDLPGSIKKIYYTENAYRFDLSNSTNPYAGTYGEYPSLNPLELKSLYLKTISNINTNFYPDIKFPKVEQDQLLFTVGSIEGIDLVLRSFCEPHIKIPYAPLTLLSLPMRIGLKFMGYGLKAFPCAAILSDILMFRKLPEKIQKYSLFVIPTTPLARSSRMKLS